MRIPSLLLLGAVLQFSAAACSFADEPGPQPLTWQDCVGLASASNPSLLAAKHDMESARALYYVSLNNFFPSLNLRHSFSRSGDNSGLDPDSWSAGANMSISLLDFGNIKDLKSKKTSLKKAEEVLRQTGVNLRKTLSTAFAELLYAQRKIGLMESIAELRVKNAKMVALQYEGGRESKGNMMRATALADQAKADIEKARLSLRTSQRKLLAAIGQDSLSVAVASGTLSVPERQPEPDIEAVAQNSPDVKVAGYALELSRISLESAQTDAYPTLTATQSLSWTGRQEFPGDRSWGVGLALNLPIFSGGPTSYWQSKSSANQLYLSAKESYRNTLLSTRHSAQNAWTALLSALYDCSLDLEMLSASQQRHSESTIKYLAGRMIFENWETIEQELVNAEKAYLDTLRDTALAQAAWDALKGKTLGEKP